MLPPLPGHRSPCFGIELPARSAPPAPVGYFDGMVAHTETEKPEPELAVRHAEAGGEGAFLVERDGERLAELAYRRDEAGRAVIEHTNVSEALRGQGVARRLVDAAVAWSRSSGVKLVPVCTYAKKVLEHDPGLRDVLG